MSDKATGPIVIVILGWLASIAVLVFACMVVYGLIFGRTAFRSIGCMDCSWAWERPEKWRGPEWPKVFAWLHRFGKTHRSAMRGE